MQKNNKLVIIAHIALSVYLAVFITLFAISQYKKNNVETVAVNNLTKH